VHREKSVKELKELIISHNLVNQSFAEPFAKSIEEKIFEYSNTKIEYDKKLTNTMKVIQSKTICISDLAQIETYLNDNDSIS